jgi:hypothetical protein
LVAGAGGVLAGGVVGVVDGVVGAGRLTGAFVSDVVVVGVLAVSLNKIQAPAASRAATKRMGRILQLPSSLRVARSQLLLGGTS